MHEHPRTDPWQLPSLERFGEQLLRTRPRRRRDLRAGGGVLALALALIGVALIFRGAPAGATSVVNRAPAAAIRSRSVRFASEIVITSSGRAIRGFRQTGAIDFAHGSYRTLLTASRSQASTEFRSVDGILYSAYAAQSGHRLVWAAVALTPAERRRLASAPESDALTDPLALLRILQGTNAAVHYLHTASIEGTPTDCYAFAADLARVLLLSDPARRIPPSYTRTGAEFEVCLDGDGRPRAISETLTHGPLALSARVIFGGYGRPTSIASPHGAHMASRRIATPQPLFGAPTRIFERLLGASA